jgi:hypothetical protein
MNREAGREELGFRAGVRLKHDVYVKSDRSRNAVAVGYT